MKTTLVDIMRGTKIFLGGLAIGIVAIVCFSVVAHLVFGGTTGIYVYTGVHQGGVGFWGLGGFEWDGAPGLFVCDGQC